jgi:hypothetical protein
LKDAAIANALGLENATQVAMAVLRARRKGNATPLVTKLEELLPKILALRGEGKTFREIGESFGHGEGQKAALWAINYVARAKRRGLLGQDGAILPGAFDVHRTGRGVSVSKVCVVEKVAAARDSSVLWLVTDKGDSDARALVDGTSVGKAPHYSRQKPGAKLFTRNGQNLVFMTEDKLAVWVTFRPAPGKAVRPDGMDAWECTMFRNEGPWRSSDLVREAVELSVALWGPVPKDGFITFVKSESVGRGTINHIPGYCYRRAGWKHRGQSSDGKPRFVAPIQKSCRPFNAWGWKAGRGGKLRLAIEASTFRVEGPSA